MRTGGSGSAKLSPAACGGGLLCTAWPPPAPAMDCYTANWNPLGDSAFYRKYELYSMDWDLKEELRDCLVAAAPYGGPIALLRNPWRKEKAASVRPVLDIYSASGMPLASLLWKSGPVVALGWSAEEELLCVQEDGAVLVYGLHGDFRRHFSMGNEVLQNRVLDARIFHTEFGSGVAILTGAYRFTLSANVGDLKLRRMPEVPGLQSAPSCWTTLCQDRVAHILLAVGPDLYLLDHATCSTVTPPGLAPGVSSFLQMAVSFTYRHLALFTDTGYIWMGTTSLKEKLCEFNCNIRAPPKQMVWCSRPRSKERAVVVAWEKRLMVVGDAPESIQYKQLTIQVLLDRLVLRRLYPLAIQICEYLRLPEVQGVSRILAHWACYKVQQKDVSDEDVARAINQKLGDTPGVSYSDIAARAYGCGRTELAIKLLEYEPRSGEQVPLLLKMKRSKLALNKAIESGDTDLVFTVLLHLKNELNRGDFFMTLRNQPMALSLYRQYCKHQELETLKDLYNQDDNHQELGSFHVRASYMAEERIEGRVAALQTAADAFYKAKNEFAAKATEDQMRLLRLQRRLEDELGGQFLDLSLHDTVTTLILGGHNKRAEQLARDFRIPDKRLWWLKLTALANLEDWEELEKFSKSKKSPIGYLPFVEICMKQHNKYEAKKYAARVGPEQKVKALLLVGDVAQAADVAIEHRNEAELSLVLSHCTGATDGATADKIQRARAQAQKK
ncbi:vacuolar protein sorting-associated protein 16 homolog isoform X2 [Ochotona curzoniae]|uniref:vacuolar protein sorting-associated protein 16 homolog isoform X2 n=1 Tax=Ochotona curzoniae TaxID=130825 RepID=UPI001B34B80C|nr:vacuolar protein sorting-associated protein 16 homolog isoform X2 [Ochotona curzoniae]